MGVDRTEGESSRERGPFYQEACQSVGVSLSVSRSGSNTREVDADWMQT